MRGRTIDRVVELPVGVKINRTLIEGTRFVRESLVSPVVIKIHEGLFMGRIAELVRKPNKR